MAGGDRSTRRSSAIGALDGGPRQPSWSGLILRRGARIYDLTRTGSAPEEPRGDVLPDAGQPSSCWTCVDVRDDGRRGPTTASTTAPRLIITAWSTRSTAPTTTSPAGCWSAPSGELDAELEEIGLPLAARRGWPISASPTTTRRWRSTASSTPPASASAMATVPRKDHRRRADDGRRAIAGRRRGAAGPDGPRASACGDTERFAVRARRRRSSAAGDELDELPLRAGARSPTACSPPIGSAPGDDEAVAAALATAWRPPSISRIERLAPNDDERGARGAAHHPTGPPVSLSASDSDRQGASRLAARPAAAKGPFGAHGVSVWPRGVRRDRARGRRRSVRPLYPRLLDWPPGAGERPFQSLADLARAAAAVERAAAAQAMLRGLGVEPRHLAPDGPLLADTGADAAAVDAALLARTVLVKRLLGAGGKASDVAPLDPREVRAFDSNLVHSRSGPPTLPVALAKRARELLVAAAPAELAGAAVTVDHRSIAGLAPLEPVLVRKQRSAPQASAGARRRRRHAPRRSPPRPRRSRPRARRSPPPANRSPPRAKRSPPHAKRSPPHAKRSPPHAKGSSPRPRRRCPRANRRRARNRPAARNPSGVDRGQFDAAPPPCLGSRQPEESAWDEPPYGRLLSR